jgi:hypothetical protein
MFDRAACPHPPRLITSPFVSMDALSMLSDLLRRALKPPLSSSNAPHSGASKSSHDQNRGEAHDHATMRSPIQPPAMSAERRRLQQSDHSQQIDMFDGVTPTKTPAWRDLPEETRGMLTGLMARLILEHAQASSQALGTEADHDH